MNGNMKTPTTENILELVRSQYMDLDEAGVNFESRGGGYQTTGTGAVPSDDLVDYLLNGTESDERDEMVSILDGVSVEWIKR